MYLGYFSDLSARHCQKVPAKIISNVAPDTNDYRLLIIGLHSYINEVL